MIYCANCGFKSFVEEGLIEVKNAPLPARADGKTREFKELSKKFKCPKCGYLMKCKKEEIKNPPVVVEEEEDIEKELARITQKKSFFQDRRNKSI